MTTHRNSFENQTIGADITTANTATSGDQLTLTKNGTGTAKYTATNATPPGSRAAILTPQAGFTVYLDDLGYNDLNHSRSFTFYYEGLPSVSQTIMQFRNTSGQCANITITTTGKIQMQNSAGSNVGQSVNSLVPGHIYRVEAQCFSDAAAGKLRVQYFLDNAGAAVESLVATGDSSTLITRGGAITFCRHGFPAGTNGWASLTIDDIQGQDGVLAQFGPYPTNVPPTANAGPDQTGVEPFHTVTLDASASTDIDGTIASYSWSHVSGPYAGALDLTDPIHPTYKAPATLAGGTDVWQLTATDDDGAVSSSDSVSVTVLPHTLYSIEQPGAVLHPINQGRLP